MTARAVGVADVSTGPSPGGSSVATAPMPSFSYRPALDGLRALAVAGVIAYHVDVRWAQGGFLGVDLFFVLSGYLITSLLLGEHSGSGRVNLGRFWLRRAKRLLPAVVLLLVAVTAYARLVAPTDLYERFRDDSLASLFYVANWRFIASGTSYFDLFNEASPLRHMWSLAVEEQFYLLWPLVVSGVLILSRSRRTLGLVIAAATVASAVVMVITYDGADPSRAYFGTDARIHQPLIGAGLAMLLPVLLARGVPRVSLGRVGALCTGLVVVAFAIVRDTDRAYYHGGSLAFAVLVAVAVAAASESPEAPLSKLLSARSLVWVGQRSYGLYLWHWPMTVWLTRERTGLDGGWLQVAIVAATFGVAVPSYALVERPIRRSSWPDRRMITSLAGASAVCALVIATTSVGATTNVLDEDVTFALPDPLVVRTAADGSTLPSFGVVGDSVSASIARGLDSTAPDLGAVSAAFAGCGLAAGTVVVPGGQVWAPSTICADEVARVHSEWIERDDPDVIIWYSEWETQDRLVGGEVAEWGTPEHVADLRAALLDAIDRLTAGGAKLVMLLDVPRSTGDKRNPAIDWAERTREYNDLLRAVAAERADRVDVVDLPAIVCPSGPPCPRSIDGVVLRPDGAHYGDEGAPWLIERLRPILDAYDVG